MVKKFFPLDKNYLLEAAQLKQEQHLLQLLMDQVKEGYFQLYNPLRLPDQKSDMVLDYVLAITPPLQTFYLTLAAIYRLKHGDNQLTFLWDGADHAEHYSNQWSNFFTQSIQDFCQHELFIKAVLDLTVFYARHQPPQMAENKMNHFMLKYFGVKMHKQHGLVRVA